MANDTNDAYTQAQKVPNGIISSFLSNSSESSQHDPALEEEVLESIRGDTFLINWQGPTDRGSPQNLAGWRKWVITVSLALYALTTTFSSSVFNAAGHALAIEYGENDGTVIFGCSSLFMIGFAFGPMLWG